MKLLVSIFIVFILAACKSNSAGELNLSSSDSVVILFHPTRYSDSISKLVSTADEAAIKTIVNYVNGSVVKEDAKCGFNGKLVFYKSNQVQKAINFNYAKDGCGHFEWNQNDK